MNLLLPALLPFAALGLIPILIHLLLRRRFRSVRWAAARFLLAALERSRRRMQVRELVLMGLRALGLAAVGLAAARPAILPRRAGSGGAAVTAVVVLDNSLSMQHAGHGETRFALAQRRAIEAVESLPNGSAAALLLASDLCVEAVPEPTRDLAAVSAEIRRARPCDGGTDLIRALLRAVEIAGSGRGAGSEVFVVSDVQAAGWPPPEDPTFQRLLKAVEAANPRPRLYVVDAGSDEGANAALGGIRCSETLAVEGERLTVEATLYRFGGGPSGETVVECYESEADGSVRRKIGAVVVRDSSPRAPVRFETALKGGIRRLELQIPADPLPADNAARLSVAVLRQMHALVVDGTKENPELPFDGEAGFIAAALSARTGDAQAIDVQVARPHDLHGRDLQSYDAVILADVEQVPGAFLDKLIRHVSARGMGLLIAAGENVDPGHYNEALGPVLLPVRIGPMAQPAEEAATFGFSLEGLEHPVMRLFADPDYRPLLAEPRFRRARQLLPAETGQAGAAHAPTTVLSFDTGQVCIAERRVGRGRVLVFGCDTTRRWSDFPLRPAFPILVRRAVHHAGQADRQDLTVNVHDPLAMEVSATAAHAPVEIRGPGGATERRMPRMALDRGYGEVSFEATGSAGFYVLASLADRTPALCYAVNPPVEESDPSALPQETFVKRYGGLDAVWVARNQDVSETVRQTRTGVELWMSLLLTAALCLVAEQCLAARWAPRDA